MDTTDFPKSKEDFIALIKEQSKIPNEKRTERERCGDCAAFKTHFCTFFEAGVVLEGDDACDDFWSLKARIGNQKNVRYSGKKFEREVDEL